MESAVQSTVGPQLPAPMLLHVLVVDDESQMRRLIKQRLERRGLSCSTAANFHEATQKISRTRFDVVLTDLNMPEGSGLDLAAWVQREHPQMPVVLVTGTNEARQATRALKSGVSDYIVKPFEIDDLVSSLSAAVRESRMRHKDEQRRTQLEAMVTHQTEELSKVMAELQDTHEATLEALGMALQVRDYETLGHSRRVAGLSRAIAKQLRLTTAELDMISYGSYLHDIGKIGIADAILRKPGPLTLEERISMREHVEIGYRMVESIPFLRPASEIIRCHHESFDGSGYPRGLSGEQIPLGARIFAVADTVDAITSDRPYRRAQSLQAAKAEVLRCAGTQFDPMVVGAFLRVPEAEINSILMAEKEK